MAWRAIRCRNYLFPGGIRMQSSLVVVNNFLVHLTGDIALNRLRKWPQVCHSMRFVHLGDIGALSADTVFATTASNRERGYTFRRRPYRRCGCAALLILLQLANSRNDSRSPHFGARTSLFSSCCLNFDNNSNYFRNFLQIRHHNESDVRGTASIRHRPELDACKEDQLLRHHDCILCNPGGRLHQRLHFNVKDVMRINADPAA